MLRCHTRTRGLSSTRGGLPDPTRSAGTPSWVEHCCLMFLVMIVDAIVRFDWRRNRGEKERGDDLNGNDSGVGSSSKIVDIVDNNSHNLAPIPPGTVNRWRSSGRYRHRVRVNLVSWKHVWLQLTKFMTTLHPLVPGAYSGDLNSPWQLWVMQKWKK